MRKACRGRTSQAAGAHASPKPHPSTQRLLADLQLVDVLRIDLGLDREIVRPRHHHHDGVAGIVPPGEQRVIVQDVTFAVEAGTGVGVIGPSGSGKSSISPIRHLLLKSDRSEISP